MTGLQYSTDTKHVGPFKQHPLLQVPADTHLMVRLILLQAIIIID